MILIKNEIRFIFIGNAVRSAVINARSRYTRLFFVIEREEQAVSSNRVRR
jgi:hypothetical protein